MCDLDSVLEQRKDKGEGCVASVVLEGQCNSCFGNSHSYVRLLVRWFCGNINWPGKPERVWDQNSFLCKFKLAQNKIF